MAEYREKELTGTQRQRAYRIVINNEFRQPPSIEFQEEVVNEFSEEVIRIPKGSLIIPFDPLQVITLTNPLTNEPLLDGTGKQMSVTMQEVYVQIYSAYWQSAHERDANLNNEEVV